MASQPISAMRLHIDRITDSTLADQDNIGRNQCPQPGCGFDIHVERLQVTVIDADDPGLRRQRARYLLLVMDFHERGHTQSVRQVDQLPQVGVS